MRRVLALGFVYFAYVACAGSQTQAEPVAVAEPPAPPPAPAPSTFEPAPAGAPSSSAGPPRAKPQAPDAKPVAKQSSADLDDSACPAGMQLVEGEYCSNVDYKCLRQWHDKANDKIVCEEFEPKSTCNGSKTKKRYCMDTYTWPNEKGARSEVMNRFHQAQVKCAAVGKRMCTESEWTLACEGPRMLPFPYGYVRDTNKCHGDMEWDSPDMPKVAKRDADELARLWKGVRNGSQPECISAYGVADLPGNTDEVVQSESFNEPGFKGKFDSIHSGGPWYKGVRNQCRPKIYTHDEGFYYYFLGFRCCAEPDGQATQPLTAKQRKEKWKWERVERLAGFTIHQMKDTLQKKQEGKCSCGDKDILCKTMCGTLLAPSAKDYK
ncbi:MAG TPA: SUMF1/EgtB/PvdO family nonheme iron enzyme [Polyangiaceae bacterium]|nr:SUMF1/EgtB/PvdO family nonheme iron enzyme [Polyangiaceae bacterium]